MEILTTDNKENKQFLNKKTEKVDLDKFDEEDKKDLRETFKEMRKAMNEADGVGLSANQVGIQKSFFVAQIPNKNGKPKFYKIINPEIKKKSSETDTMMEGCLSIPNKRGTVERPKKVTVEYSNLEGKRKKIEAWGMLARVFQHEIDHLNGVLFTQKAKKVYTPEELEKIKNKKSKE